MGLKLLEDWRLWGWRRHHESARGSALVSYFCCNKLPQVQWFISNTITTKNSRRQRSEMGLWDCGPSGGSRGKSMPFPASRAPPIPWVMTSVTLTSITIITSPSLTAFFLPPSYQEPWDNIVLPTLIIMYNLTISRTLT